jgi:hypothetical protein
LKSLQSHHLLVRSRREGLYDSHLVSILFRPFFTGSQVVHEKECPGPHDDKVEAHGYKDPEDRTDVVQNPVGLLGEDEDDATGSHERLKGHR